MPIIPTFAASRPTTRSFAMKRRLQLSGSPRKAKRPVMSASRFSKSASQSVKDLKMRLDNIADASKRPFMERYFRNELPFRGVQTPAVEKTVKEWARDHGLIMQCKDAPDATLIGELVRSLFESPFSEDKIAGTMYAGLIAASSASQKWDLIILFEELFKDNLVMPWSTADSLCIRVLGKMMKQHDDRYADRISSWRTAENLWQARCSVVSFAHFARDEKFRERIWENSSIVVKRPERFAKTSIGFILREVAKYDEAFMISFVEQFMQYLSTEAVRNATKHCDDGIKKKYMEMVKKGRRSTKRS